MKENILSGLRFKMFHKGKIDTYNWVDSEFVRTLRSHPKINKNLFQTKNITRIEQEYWWENDYSKNQNWKIWIIYDEKLECAIGYLNIKIDSIMHGRIQFDYVISPDYNESKYFNRIIKWTIGCAKRELINAHKLFLYIFPNSGDEKIKMLNENFGFEVDGLITEYVLKDGKYRDVYLISLLIS
jgi:diamine N-acetyltransferase